jgi:hypothetical protein
MTWRPRSGSVLVCLCLTALGCSGSHKIRLATYDCCQNGLLSVCKCPTEDPCDSEQKPFRSTGGGTCTTGPEPDAGPDADEEPFDVAIIPSPDLASDTTCSMTSFDAKDSCPRDAGSH